MRKPWRFQVGLSMSCLAIGALYGWVSARANVNPFYEPGAPAALLGQAWGWQPSPWWLPSYLLCVVPRNGYGIEHTRSGYLFRNDACRARYVGASIVLGTGLGVVAAMASLCARGACGRRRG